MAGALMLTACADATESPACGNGTLDVELGEACDDGNETGGDGCSADCTSDESCGNGILDPGETCDDGNDASGDGCQPTCAAATCGDGFVDVGELCDDGVLAASGDGKCLTTCDAFQICGNGALEGNELCDDGAANGTGDGNCLADCSGVQDCGDGDVEGTEACDDGVDNGTQLIGFCNAACTSINGCGTNCYGSSGCPTPEGRCVRFTCTSPDASATACSSCFGGNWASISYGQWLNDGYCADVAGTYFDAYGGTPQCGASGAQCCTNHDTTCGSGDLAWHFYDSAGAQNYYTGPRLSIVDSACTYYNVANSGVSPLRLTACQRVW